MMKLSARNYMTRKIRISLPKSTEQKLRRQAIRENCSMSVVINNALWFMEGVELRRVRDTTLPKSKHTKITVRVIEPYWQTLESLSKLFASRSELVSRIIELYFQEGDGNENN